MHRRKVAQDCSKLLRQGHNNLNPNPSLDMVVDSVDDLFDSPRVALSDVAHANVQRLSFCKSREAFSQAGYDPFERFQKEETVRVSPSPFHCDPGRAGVVGKEEVLVPARRWSRSQGRFKAGGFTADMGWVLMVARYALVRNKAVQFASYWGHGCAGNASAGGWTCFFEEITPETCLPQKHVRANLVMSDALVRDKVKLKDRYIDDMDQGEGSKFLRRNEEISRLAGSWLRSDNDVQTMRQVFSWVFRLQQHVRDLVQAYKEPLLEALKRPYIAMHVRWGDKVGKNNFKGEPVEGKLFPLSVYRDLAYCFYAQAGSKEVPRTIFIATDDYEAVVELKKVMGEDFHVVTTAHPRHKGFSITDYHGETEERKFDKAVGLWGDMELLAGGEVFVGSMQSNIARMVHLMRLGKPVNSTLQLSRVDAPKSCCVRNKGSTFIRNCFWTCT